MRRPYMDHVAPSAWIEVPSAKIPPSHRKINDTVLQCVTCPLEAAHGRSGGRGAQSRNYPGGVNRASLA